MTIRFKDSEAGSRKQGSEVRHSIIRKTVLHLLIPIPVLLCLLAWLTGSVYAQQPADFAYGLQIDTLGMQPVQSIVLPGIVYQHLTQDDLSDMGVFNSAGHPVPFAIHKPGQNRSPHTASLDLPLAQREAGIYSTQIPRILPVDSVHIELPASHTLVRVRVESAADPDGTWLLHSTGVAYRVQAGDSLRRSPPIRVYRNLYRYWRITLDEQPVHLLPDSLVLRVYWTPARLLFVPQGPAPYTLAFGSASHKSSSFQARELFMPVREDYDSIEDLPLASVDSIPATLGGTEQLLSNKTLPWQQIVLWSVMIAGVLLIGMVALRLLKDHPADPT